MNEADLKPFSAWLKQRLNHPLPGAIAHDAMKASPLGTKINFNHTAQPKPGGVLILLYPNQNKIYLPLILRSTYEGAHSGQISLPGGKSDFEELPEITALREAREEIGIQPGSTEVVGKLSPFYVIPSNFLVLPVVAITTARPVFIPDSREVDEIIEFEVSKLLDRDAIQNGIIQAGGYTLNAPYFDSHGKKVWGATAMMLNEFRLLLKEWQTN
jgi:8-oxo-dGTP pyrophosphatase MutT (NUDIX family)